MDQICKYCKKAHEASEDVVCAFFNGHPLMVPESFISGLAKEVKFDVTKKKNKKAPKILKRMRELTRRNYQKAFR